MCGRYFVEMDEREMVLILARAPGDVRTGEVFPGDTAAAVSRSGEVTAMRWGFEGYDKKSLLINARSETASEKRTFAQAMRTGRCLIPAADISSGKGAAAKR